MQNGIIIKAECTIFKNNIQINCKKKSKLSNLTISSPDSMLVVIGKGDNQTFKFPIHKLKQVHRKFIDEGKITLEFGSQPTPTTTALDHDKPNVQADGNFQIFVNNACKENLEFLLAKILSIRKSFAEKSENDHKGKVEKDKMNDRKQRAEDFRAEEHEFKGRRNLFSLAKMCENIKNGKQIQKPKVQVQPPKPSTSLTQLPKMLLRQVLEYSGISLSLRILSKQFNEIILKSIINLKLKQEIDEPCFHRLSRWAINLEGRFKHVKTIKLQDKYDEQELVKNRAKSLRFGTWKQITHKHIAQLKGLRIYCLEIPYAIKFEFNNLFGLRLVELRLHGKDVSVKNSFVKDEDILYIINNTQELRVIEVAYASTKLLTEIKKPQKMQEIKIGTLNRLHGVEGWTNFKKFQNLVNLSIQDTQRNGVKDDHQLLIQEVTFPQFLKTLGIGLNLSTSTKAQIPSQLKFLKLLGSHFKNNHIDEFYLPDLKILDISECPNLTPQCLENVGNLRVITNWNRNQLSYATNFYSSANISIESVKGFTFC